jgi:NurA domain
MLYRSRLITELRERRAAFVDFERDLRGEVREVAARLRALVSETSEQVRGRVEAAGGRVSFPSRELEEGGGRVAVAFARRWRSHEEARAWAAGVLGGRVTFAADGSQIYPGRETSLPVAAIQVASFENPHTPEGTYTKEAQFRIITPPELLEGDRAYESPEQVVGVRRFELEARTICEFLERRRGWRERGERAPVAFLDGTLLISSRRQNAEILFAKSYAAALVELVNLSRETEVPVVGYIDHSYAPDVRDALEALDPALPRSRAYDAQVLRASAPDGAASSSAAPLLSAWGDRTIFWHCRRPNLADGFYDARGNPLVGFVYLQTTVPGNPARLDVPVWVYEAGLLEEVLDAARAECVVGNGYPYVIETADAAAAMTGRDREQFLRAMQEFAEEHRFDFRVSRKPLSKSRRR